MHRISAPGATAGKRFTDGDVASGTPATVLDASWANDVQEEICSVIEAAGVAVETAADQLQLLTAIRRVVLQTIYPVGSFFMSVTDTRNPNVILGFGTWAAVTGAIYGRLDSDSQFGGSGAVGTLNHKHTTAAHTLTAAQIPAHTHPYRDRYHSESGGGIAISEAQPGGYNGGVGSDGTDFDNNAWAYYDTNTGSNTGGGGSHTHGDTGDAAALPRGYMAFVWRRAA